MGPLAAFLEASWRLRLNSLKTLAEREEEE
jgi:hypothetical protein